ncbi:MAG: hypothetical protein LBC20_12575 [Planctomycetaceae bacterium]|nr:hypothetical protein [Planctomycetaceae bacterium]
MFRFLGDVFCRGEFAGGIIAETVLLTLHYQLSTTRLTCGYENHSPCRVKIKK